MNIYLVRHGTTKSNEEKRYYGAYDSELSLSGIEEAKILKQKLKDIKFDSIYISSKKRCDETARIIFGKDVECRVDQRLDERNFGIFENKTYEEICKEYNYEVKAWEEDWKNYKIPLGESAVESYLRTEEFFKEIENEKAENIILITHGGFIKNSYCYILKSLDYFWKFSSKNGDISIIKYEYGNWYIDSITHIWKEKKWVK